MFALFLKLVLKLCDIDCWLEAVPHTQAESLMGWAVVCLDSCRCLIVLHVTIQTFLTSKQSNSYSPLSCTGITVRSCLPSFRFLLLTHTLSSLTEQLEMAPPTAAQLRYGKLMYGCGQTHLCASQRPLSVKCCSLTAFNQDDFSFS